MTVLHAIHSLAPVSGGPARSASELVRNLNGVGVRAGIVCAIGGDKPWLRDPAVCRVAARAGYIAAHAAIDAAIRELAPDLVHVHGIWHAFTHAACVAARRQGIPYVVAPRGMLEPWSLESKRWKKRIAMWLFQRNDLHCAAALHATAEAECAQFRKLDFRQTVIVSPNGVAFPEGMPPRTARQDGKHTALFLSRIHPKKGLMELVEAWARHVSREASAEHERDGIDVGAQRQRQPSLDWHFEYAGSDSGGHLHEVQQRMRERGVAADFTYLGVLDDEAKWQAYRRADLFLLPTYSENFGIVVAEALAAGVPVLTTTGAPWKALVDYRCGWWIRPGLDALESALPDALRMPDHELKAMGARGRDYAVTAFDWRTIAADMKRAYAWLTSGGEKPACINL